jgi:site-specific DNA recombinase
MWTIRMRAAIYARYSSDKQRESSIEDQERNCRGFAAREGWTLIARFADEATSGATRSRPGYLRMLAAAEQGGFDVLLVDDLSRLSRDDVEMKQVIRRFRFRGVRIVGVSDGFDSDAKGYKVQAGVRSLLNELYLDDLREKTHRASPGRR